MKAYETLSSWVVPRSAVKIDSDDEFTLYAVTTFKKYSHEFVHKCREQKWTPREYKFKEGGKEEEKREFEKVSKEERKLWGEVLRLARTNWGEAVMAWIHVLVLRVFVETVLRYGLPLSFVCGLVKVWKKLFLQAASTNYNRPRQNKRRKSEMLSTQTTRILRATPSVETRRGALSRMMQTTCRLLDKEGIVNTQHTYVTTSKSTRAPSNMDHHQAAANILQCTSCNDA